MPDDSYELAGPPPEKKPSLSAKPPVKPPAKPIAAKPPASVSAEVSRPAASAAPAVAADVTERVCPSCGFKVVGRKIKRCPECSGPLDAGAADLLQFSGNLWIRWISWGPILMAAAVLAFIGGGALTWKFNAMIGQLLNAAAGISLATGAFIVTASEVNGPPQRRLLWAHLSRGLTILTGLLCWADLIAVITKHYVPLALMIITLAAMAATALALALFLQGLAQRIPADSLATQFQNQMWLVPAALLVPVVAQFPMFDEFMHTAFYCTFPMLGGAVGICLWTAASYLKLSLELRSVVAASESIIARRVAREAKQKEQKR